ncbi:UNKNOWN [Stylonychia lemnae]|uniref:Uncharacterized protein n=1 Tax=Stylonychia lemnae TaxID=5949 RepID=A0A077ZX46_STYLE|nr:UNKNOWN [Stylonychia lemnae]|eukprot:CDW73812.1 UNKNOWN [Stylonychia lemnae]
MSEQQLSQNRLDVFEVQKQVLKLKRKKKEQKKVLDQKRNSGNGLNFQRRSTMLRVPNEALQNQILVYDTKSAVQINEKICQLCDRDKPFFVIQNDDLMRTVPRKALTQFLRDLLNDSTEGREYIQKLYISNKFVSPCKCLDLSVHIYQHFLALEVLNMSRFKTTLKSLASLEKKLNQSCSYTPSIYNNLIGMPDTFVKGNTLQYKPHKSEQKSRDKNRNRSSGESRNTKLMDYKQLADRAHKEAENNYALVQRRDNQSQSSFGARRNYQQSAHNLQASEKSPSSGIRDSLALESNNKGSRAASEYTFQGINPNQSDQQSNQRNFEEDMNSQVRYMSPIQNIVDDALRMKNQLSSNPQPRSRSIDNQYIDPKSYLRKDIDQIQEEDPQLHSPNIKPEFKYLRHDNFEEIPQFMDKEQNRQDEKRSSRHLKEIENEEEKLKDRENINQVSSYLNSFKKGSSHDIENQLNSSSQNSIASAHFINIPQINLRIQQERQHRHSITYQSPEFLIKQSPLSAKSTSKPKVLPDFTAFNTMDNNMIKESENEEDNSSPRILMRILSKRMTSSVRNSYEIPQYNNADDEAFPNKKGRQDSQEDKLPKIEFKQQHGSDLNLLNGLENMNNPFEFNIKFQEEEQDIGQQIIPYPNFRFIGVK